MNILLIGGASSFINNLIIKLNKEKHRVYLLTGNRYNKAPYQKVFERYNFSYDCSNLNEIFESINPDLTIFMGAYDTNFRWAEEESETIRYSAAIVNILMAYAMGNGKRFIYLSSEEVFSQSGEEPLNEWTQRSPIGYRGMVLAQAEEMCDTYRKARGLDISVLRIDHLYGIPDSLADVKDPCTRMCLEAMEKGTITVPYDSTISMIYETDAIEAIYRVIERKHRRFDLYNIASGEEITMLSLAEKVKKYMGDAVKIVLQENLPEKIILSTSFYKKEFGELYLCDRDTVIRKIVTKMMKNRRVFLYDEEKELTPWQKLTRQLGWLVKALIPFAENVVAFVLFYHINKYSQGSAFFANLNPYLLYVLIFATVHGQQQATFSALFSTLGYCFFPTNGKTGFEVLQDSNTYIWVLQLFVFGLVVGYMKDRIAKLLREQEAEREYLSAQIRDIKEINNSNIRVKDALENQIVNQNDSVGKIYSITSSLGQYSPEEVLFYAAEMIADIMKSKDVAIYTVSNEIYARLFSSTSQTARKLGGSLKYAEMTELYSAISDRKVYINRKMDENNPMMSSGIFSEDGKLQMIVMIWTLPWEKMTLGQANQLVIIGDLIRDAVLRANQYLAALEEKRHINGSKLLQTDAFVNLTRAYVHAEKKGLAECTLLRVSLRETADYCRASEQIAAIVRPSDYVGRLSDGNIYILLSNTRYEDAQYALTRLEEAGFQAVALNDVEEEQISI